MFAGPEYVIGQLDIKPGMQIADIGAGIGHYTIMLAKALHGTNGRVFAIDVQKDLLDKLSREVQQQGLSNVEVVWSDAEEHEGTRLRDESVDMVMLANILFQLDNKQSVFDEAFRILKKDGQLVIVDWLETAGGIGPKASLLFTKETADDIARKHGFVFDKELDGGSHHYALLFHK
jgi:ubiquinone/menaquinone biosynthesis C-methylase UbiE